jgi:hypothetical protein
MIGLAKGDRASWMVVILNIVINTGMSRAVIGMGMHSVTHQVMTRKKTASSL